MIVGFVTAMRPSSVVHLPTRKPLQKLLSHVPNDPPQKRRKTTASVRRGPSSGSACLAIGQVERHRANRSAMCRALSVVSSLSARFHLPLVVRCPFAIFPGQPWQLLSASNHCPEIANVARTRLVLH